MKKLVLASVIALSLAACGKSEEPAATAPAAPAPTAATPPPAAPVVDPAAALASRIDAALAGAHRSEENRARDKYRHPKETLTFFGLTPTSTVIEITPGGGWYTEVLAPIVRDGGKLVVAIPQPASAKSDNAKGYYEKGNTALREKLAATPAVYDQVDVTEFALDKPSFGPANSADVVLTFRNVHNWTGNETDDEMFRGFAEVLKPGGVLGVVDHRANPGTDSATSAKSGYVTEEYVIKLATDAGLELVEKSEINANPADTKDYEKGVWTLPPGYAEKDKDREKYAAIGESDRMTLRFRKPGGDVQPGDETTGVRAPAGEGEQVDSFEPVAGSDAASKPKP